MLPYKTRVIAEQVKLDAKLHKLDQFIRNQTGPFKDLDDSEKLRLMRQSNAMREYSNILGERIAAFPPATQE